MPLRPTVYDTLPLHDATGTRQSPRQSRHSSKRKTGKRERKKKFFFVGEVYTLKLHGSTDQSDDRPAHIHTSLLERDEAGGVGGAQTGAAVGHGLVGDGELTEVVADHTGLNKKYSLANSKSSQFPK